MRDVPTIRSLAIGTPDMPKVQRGAFILLSSLLGLSAGIALLRLFSVVMP